MITERIIAPARFSHASAITSFRQGTLFACYTGDAECHRTQKVCLYYFHDNGAVSKPATLEDLTGNPVLLTWGGPGLGTIHPDREDNWTRSAPQFAKIIYSKFEKLVPSRVEWWQHCSLWVRDVGLNKEGEIIAGPPQQLMFDGEEDQPEDYLGYLPRCNPITTYDGYLLPLYRENDPHFHGTILHSEDAVNWTYQGTIGRGTRCIQPTLWREDGKIHALLRNFFYRWAPNSQRFAYYSCSEDNGKTWSELSLSKFPNCNNSILAIDCYNRDTRKKQMLYIWNNDLNGRQHLTLGTEGRRPLVTLDGYGSYPAACIHDNKLHITYTAKANHYKSPYAKTVIKYKQYCLLQLLNEGLKYDQANSPLNSPPSTWV